MKILLLCCFAVMLAGCGAPGVELLSSAEASAIAAAPSVDIDAIVAQRQTATAVARQPASASQAAVETALPVAAEGVSASPGPTAEPSVALPSITLNPLPVTASGAGGLMVLGREGTLDGLSEGAWINLGTATPGCYKPSAVIGDGSAWLACGEATELTADGAWNEADLPQPVRLFRDRQQRVWALSRETVQVRENGAWTVYTATETIDSPSFPIDSMAFSPDGTVWLGGFNTDNVLVSFDGQRWRGWGTKLGLEFNGYPTALLATESGELLAGTNDGAVVRWEGERFAEVIPPKKLLNPLDAVVDAPELRELVQTPDGTVWIASDVGLYSWQDGKLRIYDTAEGLPGREIYDIQADAAGRLWVATAYGIAVRELDAWRAVQPSTSGLSASHIVALAVEGAPELPASLAEPRITTIAGRVTRGSEPLAERDVRLCSEELTTSRRGEASGPCSNMSFYATAKSGVDGEFRFDNVPVGTYFMVVRDGAGGWVDVGGAVVALESGGEVRADIKLP